MNTINFEDLKKVLKSYITYPSHCCSKKPAISITSHRNIKEYKVFCVECTTTTTSKSTLDCCISDWNEKIALDEAMANRV